MSTRALPVSLSVAIVFGAACAGKTETTPPVADGEPARRTAISFVHCVEGGGAGCIPSGVEHGGWDAFHLLGWLAGGSPLSILQVLPRELRDHGDPRQVQARFVGQVEEFGALLRGAECDATAAQPLAGLIEQVAEVARRRLDSFGLLGSEMSEVVNGLRAEAMDSLGQGFLVRFGCKSDPYQLYLATADQGGRHQVVGMTTTLPQFLGGDGANRDIVTGRLRSRTLGLHTAAAPVSEGVVHRWVPVPMEDF